MNIKSNSEIKKNRNHINDINKHVHSCTGCGMCSAVCPVSAITMNQSKDGFYIPFVREDICVSCGICQKICYKYDQDFTIKNCEPLECMSAINRDEEELKKSSSGAVSIELMKKCLQLGYYIVGVSYDYKRDIAVTQIATDEKEIESFRGSKYFQSYTAEAFKKILNDKTNQKYAIFGTPCQIYAFAKVAKIQKNRKRFLLVDIFCHGCPSLVLWKKYIHEKKKKYQIKEFNSIKFRSKVYGWHEYAFDFSDGFRTFSSDKYNDPFYEIFFGKDVMNEACYDCKPRSSIENTDIRLGDFWGWQYDTDVKGVSAVIINTAKGAEIFNSIRDRFVVSEFKFEDIIASQSYGKNYSCNEQRRKTLLILLRSNMSMKKIQYKYRQLYPLKEKINRNVKNLLKHMPLREYNLLKKNLHKKCF